MGTEQNDEPIHACVEAWHANLRGELAGGLDELLHPDCVFLSPIVFRPQVGAELTKLYLSAAGNTLVGDEPPGDGEPSGKGFHYVKEIVSGHHAALEFETVMDGIAVNGVDIITCDDRGKIIEFKVMIRPLKAINLVHAQMKAMLELMQAAD